MTEDDVLCLDWNVPIDFPLKNIYIKFFLNSKFRFHYNFKKLQIFMYVAHCKNEGFLEGKNHEKLFYLKLFFPLIPSLFIQKGFCKMISKKTL